MPERHGCVMTFAEVRDLIVAWLPAWQDRFSTWAVVIGLLSLVAGSGLVRSQPAQPGPCRDSDVLRVYRLGKYRQPRRAPRFGWLMCSIGAAPLALPFVDVGWFT